MVSIDEIIVRFTGRSVHTTMMRGKPVPEGYKVFALCDAGYIFAFLFDSPVARCEGDEPLRNEAFNRIDWQTVDLATLQIVAGLSKTSKAVLRLALQLPREGLFIVFMDNYFNNVQLFRLMRGFGLGACGTARRNSLGWPEEFKRAIKDRRTDRLAPDTLSGVVKDGVLAIVWQDTNLVHFLTTAHDGSAKTTVRRKKPSAGNANRWYRNFVQTIWGDRPVVDRLVPTFAVEYNYFMGSVDIHDQLRSYNPTPPLAFCRGNAVWTSRVGLG